MTGARLSAGSPTGEGSGGLGVTGTTGSVSGVGDGEVVVVGTRKATGVSPVTAARTRAAGGAERGAGRGAATVATATAVTAPIIHCRARDTARMVASPGGRGSVA